MDIREDRGRNGADLTVHKCTRVHTVLVIRVRVVTRIGRRRYKYQLLYDRNYSEIIAAGKETLDRFSLFCTVTILERELRKNCDNTKYV